MPRIRYIKPDFFKDEDLAKLPPLYRLAFEGLWCHADKEGRLKDRPGQLKIEILPYDEIDFNEVLETLSKPKIINNHTSFITRYVINGEKYIQINKFKEHQKVHHTEKDSLIPPISLTVKQRRKSVTLRIKKEGMEMEKGMEKGMEKEATKLPEWIPSKEWNSYSEMRKKIKKPLTEDAIEIAIEKLKHFKDTGHDIKAILKQSIFNSWQGLFEVKENIKAKGNVPKCTYDSNKPCYEDCPKCEKADKGQIKEYKPPLKEVSA